VWTINPIGEQQKIFVMHQAAMRWLRKDIATQLRKSIKEVEQAVEVDDMLQRIEEEAKKVEMSFLTMMSEEGSEESRIPVFDFEIN
jgi:hypothetical protein